MILQAPRLSDAAEVLKDFGELYLVYDESVAGAASVLVGELPFRATLALEVSEEAKSMETVLGICSLLMSSGASREAVLVALGGGTVSDIAGFAAAIYKRGIRSVNIPTTVLAQVDAGIGGKCGVNFEGYKNMLGAFWQPLFTILCPEVLETLPHREFLSGAAEVLKTFIIDNTGGRYERALGLLASPDNEGLSEMILAAARIKAGIVERDPFEKGERTVLNLGHTFAHAIEHEAASRDEDITHGEAVAMGLVLSGRLSDALGESSGMGDRLQADLSGAGLRVLCPYPVDILIDAMRRDKKAVGERVRFVLPKAIGEVVIREIPLDSPALK